MRIKTLFVRFYKSFNFDFLRKYNHKATHQPWDYVDDSFVFPYVKIPIDSKVTAIVGANESGKSHLLSAIEKGLTGEKIANEDMCRYSEFYTVETGKRKVPDFGFEFYDLTPEEHKLISDLFKDNGENITFDSFYFFRTQKQIHLYLPASKDIPNPKMTLSGKESERLQKLLPRPFRIKSNIALPNRVSIKSLYENDEKGYFNISREARFSAHEVLHNFAKNNAPLFENTQAVKTNAANIPSAVKPIFDLIGNNKEQQNSESSKEEIKLARDLICKIAKVDSEALKELYNSLKDGKDGHASGLVKDINRQLSVALNFPNWWVQDKQFELRVSPREVDLVFTIKDRTGTEYSFSERSNGLKYFLSYYVQYLAHESQSGIVELLTMDEPDAYLSSQAQQDLLKIFESFAVPHTEDRDPIQVIYVTHSPFLIDKNHAERIRVLEKGVSDEGTRVVKDAGRNHYEPLRSAFGAFVGETVFIGNTNLVVEGLTDQIILAGAANYLRKRIKIEDETLDLNRLTIVPAGGAPNVPYIVYLARGRDPEKPPIVVLLDNDKQGKDAKQVLERGGLRGKQILPQDFIFLLGDLQSKVSLHLSTKELIDIEDLIPLPLCVLSVREYLKSFCDLDEEKTQEFTEDMIRKHISPEMVLFDSIEAAVKEFSSNLWIEKMGFSRSLVDVLNTLDRLDSTTDIEAALQQFEHNMKSLFAEINVIRRKAEREFTREKVSQKVKRVKQNFITDHPNTANRQLAYILFEGIEASLDDSSESDSVRNSLQRIRREFNIDTERHLPIDNYENFKDALKEVQYAPLQTAQIEI